MGIVDNRIKKILNYLKWLFLRRSAGFTILSDDDTLDRILTTGCSVSRFGEGELRVIAGGGNGLQQPDEELGRRLEEVLQAPETPGCLVCLPEPFLRMKDLKLKSRSFWTDHFVGKYAFLKSVIPAGRAYGSATFSRFYIDHTDRKKSARTLEKIKRIWEKQDIYIIEGVSSKLGVGNDLFAGANSIKRITAPPTSAFSKYREIYSAALELIPKGSLVLLALGMTATVLAYDLGLAGYRAIDIGHIDIEYEWFRMKAKWKCPIPGKAVNECGDVNPESIGEDASYTASILRSIS